jgi:hypothetical protein
MNSMQRGNIVRSLTEIGTYIALMAVAGLVGSKWEDDDDEWYKNFILYQLKRSRTELGVMIPSP